MKESKALGLRLALVVGLGLVAMLALAATSAFAGTQVPLSGVGSPTTGDFTPSGGNGTLEFPGAIENEAGPAAYNGVVDRSLSTGVGHGASVNSGQRAKSNPTQVGSFGKVS